MFDPPAPTRAMRWALRRRALFAVLGLMSWGLLTSLAWLWPDLHHQAPVLFYLALGALSASTIFFAFLAASLYDRFADGAGLRWLLRSDLPTAGISPQ